MGEGNNAREKADVNIKNQTYRRDAEDAERAKRMEESEAVKDRQRAPAVMCRGVTKYFEERGGDGRAPGWPGLFGRRARRRITAVDRLSFTIPKGEIFGILGPNGSGKSTLIRMLSTLILPDAGEIEVFGRDVVADSLAVRRTINRVSVDAAFFKKLSAWENLSYAARLYGVPRGEARERTASILEEMGFSREKMEQPVEALSRGMQQKVAIARALFTSPALLLMDEPTTGLDPVSKRQVQDHTLRVRERHDTTVLLTTHDMDEAERICDRIAIIHRGRFIVEGTLADLRGHVGRDGASLEDIFIELTGKELVELDEEK